MINIAICDDDKFICSELESYIAAYAKKSLIDYRAEIFYSGEKLCEFLKENPSSIELLFLDIELAKMNGVEAGQFIRDTLKNETTQIVYVSGKNTYALELFKIRPFDFLIKPVSEEQIENLMAKYIELHQIQKKFFSFCCGRNNRTISVENIYYFFSEGKKVNIMTSHGVLSYYGRLSDVTEQLDPEYFWPIHKSYIVNMHMTASFTKDHCIMVNSDILPVSKPYRQEIKQRIIKYQKQENAYEL